MNDITIINGQGGLGRPLTGQDHVSGLIFYSNTLPSGFTTTNRVKQVFSLNDAESLGIKNDFSDETQATAVITVTGAGATGDTITIKVTEPSGVVQVCSYTKQASDTTATIFATSIVATINANTLTNGYSATNTAGAITLKVRKGLGVFPSATGLNITTTGSISATATTLLGGGVASQLAVLHYYVSEYFRIQPKGELYIGVYPIPTTFNFSEILHIQNTSNGRIRQLGIYKNVSSVDSISNAFVSSDLNLMQDQCTLLEIQKKPLSILFAPDILGLSVNNLPDLNAFTCKNISVVIGQDGTSNGNTLFKTTNKSTPCLGAVLGATSLAKVNESIAWVAKFNLSNGIELENLAFSNGVLFSDASITENLLDAVNNKRYIFLRKFSNYTGSYFNDNHSAIIISSDYAYLNDNRVIDKARRGIYQGLLPVLNSPLKLNANGTLANSTIVYLESQAVTIVGDMVRNDEISSIDVVVDPTNNVASTSEVKVKVTIVPIGVARKIIVNLGYAVTV